MVWYEVFQMRRVEHLRNAMLNVVNHKQSRLPTDYQEVEWIQGVSVRSYVNLSVNWNSKQFTNETTNFIFSIVNEEYLYDMSLCGSSGVGKPPLVFLKRDKTEVLMSDSSTYCSIGSYSIFGDNPLTVECSVVTANKQSLITIGNATTSYSAISPKYKEITVDVPHQNFHCNLIPCYRKSDDVIGFYDIENNIFYDSVGQFEKGADV